MTAALLALVVAVVTVVAYGVLADRFDYASVRRRQLDIWASLSACLCFTGIVLGGVSARMQAPLPVSAPTESVPAPGDTPADGQAAAWQPGGTTLAKAPIQLLAPAQPIAIAPGGVTPAVAAGPDAGPDAGDEDGDEGDVATPNAGAVGPPPASGGATPGALVPPVGLPSATVTAPRPTAAPPESTPTATAAAGRITRGVPPPAQRTPSPPPVLPTATLEPPPLPSMMPSCGDPNTGDLALSGLTANADRDGDELVVRFDAQVRNGASYPLTLADISIVALNQTAGSEQYGHARLSDIAIEPGAFVRLDGAVQLTKLPPPFGRTELCLSYVVDSCGQRADRTVRQCTTVRGF